MEEIPERLAEVKATYEKAIEEAKKAIERAEKLYKEAIAQIESEKADYEARKANAEKWLANYEENNPEKLDTAEQLRKAEEHNKWLQRLPIIFQRKNKQTTKKQKRKRWIQKLRNYPPSVKNLFRRRNCRFPDFRLVMMGWY